MSKTKSSNKRKAATAVAAATTEPIEEAEIAYILKERGGKAENKKNTKKKQKTTPTKHEYLCAWTDGQEPQWVDAKYLKGTPALEEWQYQEDEEPEEFDAPPILEEKCQTLANLLQQSKRPCFLLGAGISAPALPTFRGKNGLWTKNAHKNEKQDAKPSTSQPTLAHRGLVALEKIGKVHWVTTQNYDDLSARSGFPTAKLSELHGNIFTETCDDCHTVFHRDFEVPLDTSENHETGRNCEKCQGVLRDSIIHFEEDLPWHDLKMSNAKFVGSDLTVVLGSSLQVEPAASLPFRSKRRNRRNKDIKSVIVNLQKTPYDDEADLLIRGTCDDVIDKIAKQILGESWDTSNTSVVDLTGDD
mmetsp:Transcript_18612/g.26268  ORF Transcript_18612/g.26268 Transcript_18612/m.26268 type:complete len:359 (+) Transcript_18612:34-1110(+)